jgi:hypothetical protein
MIEGPSWLVRNRENRSVCVCDVDINKSLYIFMLNYSPMKTSAKRRKNGECFLTNFTMALHHLGK